jgi:hypothetical protein
LHALVPKPFATVRLPHSLNTQHDGSIPGSFPLLLLLFPLLSVRLILFPNLSVVD